MCSPFANCDSEDLYQEPKYSQIFIDQKQLKEQKPKRSDNLHSGCSVQSNHSHQTNKPKFVLRPFNKFQSFPSNQLNRSFHSDKPKHINQSKKSSQSAPSVPSVPSSHPTKPKQAKPYGGAGMIIFDINNIVYLLYSKKLRKYVSPGGNVDEKDHKSDPLLYCAIREGKEETCLSFNLKDPQKVVFTAEGKSNVARFGREKQSLTLYLCINNGSVFKKVYRENRDHINKRSHEYPDCVKETDGIKGFNLDKLITNGIFACKGDFEVKMKEGTLVIDKSTVRSIICGLNNGNFSVASLHSITLPINTIT